MSEQETNTPAEPEEQTVPEEPTEQVQFEEQTQEEEDSNLLSAEELDSMSDTEFEEYMKSGKVPAKQPEQPEQPTAPEPVKQDTPPEAQKQPSKAQTAPAGSPGQVEQKPQPEPDYKAVYEQLFKPFKANGKEITPRSVEDIVSLMQMGANYTRKMQLLAPMKKMAESLSKASIKEDDVSFLIDVFKGDKEAIKSLLKKHEIDPVDLDLESISYKKDGKNLATDRDIEFSDVLLDASESLPKIQTIVNDVWDSKSKSQLMNDPRLLRALHEEIQLGRFDKVQKVVEQEKILGRYRDASDLEAYIDVLRNMEQTSQPTQQAQPVSNPQDTAPRVKTPDKTKAAPTKGTKGKPSKANISLDDLFSMSEEEFNKLSVNDLM